MEASNRTIHWRAMALHSPHCEQDLWWVDRPPGWETHHHSRPHGADEPWNQALHSRNHWVPIPWKTCSCFFRRTHSVQQSFVYTRNPSSVLQWMCLRALFEWWNLFWWWEQLHLHLSTRRYWTKLWDLAVRPSVSNVNVIILLKR